MSEPITYSLVDESSAAVHLPVLFEDIEEPGVYVRTFDREYDLLFVITRGRAGDQLPNGFIVEPAANQVIPIAAKSWVTGPKTNFIKTHLKADVSVKLEGSV